MSEQLIGDLHKGGGLQHFWMPKGSPQIPRIARAEGMYVWDQAGRSYMDCTSGPVVVMAEIASKSTSPKPSPAAISG